MLYIIETNVCINETILEILGKQSKCINHSTMKVCSGCCNRIPYTEWFMNDRNLFLTVLESRKSRIKVLADQMSDEHPPSSGFIDGHLLTVPSDGRRGQGSSQLSLS